jgi:hypothetical protein
MISCSLYALLPAGHVRAQTLNALKTRLSDLLREAVHAKAEIKARSAVLARLQGDVSAVSEHLAKSQVAGETLARAVREAEDLPTVMDYLGLKRTQQDLSIELASWRRKVDILELAARQALASPARSGPSTGLSSTSAFGSGAPARTGLTTLGAGSGAPQGHATLSFSQTATGAPPRGIAGFSGTLYRAKAGVSVAGTLQLGLPPAVRAQKFG